MKFLIYTLIPFLFFVGCNCDEGYCPPSTYIDIHINYDENFTFSELRNSKLIFLDTVRHLAVDSMFLISKNQTDKNTWLEFHEEIPDRNQIFVLNFNDFSDTLRNFTFDSNLIQKTCKLGCGLFTNKSIVDYTEITNFQFTHKSDTIRNFEVFIKK